MTGTSSAEFVFKTIYFPRDKVQAGSSARVTISLPADPSSDHHEGLTPDLIANIRRMSSREIRAALGDPILEDLEALAKRQGRSLSNACLRILKDGLNGSASPNSRSQLALPFEGGESAIATKEPRADLGVTFRESVRQGAFGWFPYVEGFSATYTRDAIQRAQPTAVFDPFGGAGTTQLAAACLGIPSGYAEINPFMAFVADTKVNSARWARRNLSRFQGIAEEFLRAIRPQALLARGKRVDLGEYERAFPDRNFFQEADIRALLAAKELTEELSDGQPHARALLVLACAANAVKSSNMTRRADLRRRRPDEYKTRVVNVSKFVSETIARIVRDVQDMPTRMAATTKLADDCRTLGGEHAESFDFALTSPPYLNGTNYFRNTKIELWLAGFIKSEKELGDFRRRAVAAGINNISKDKGEYLEFEGVERVARDLDVAAADRRIPLLVRHYFSDMFAVMLSVHRALRPGARFLLDIGDSRFYSVHVPTDHLLAVVAEQAGFKLLHRHLLARRHSRDKTPLVQMELVFEKPKQGARPTGRQGHKTNSGLKRRIKEFSDLLPYQQHPFSKRNWGDPLHSLCSYQGKFKPAIAHWLVEMFLPKGGSLLDPLGGVGTVPLEGALHGARTVSNDKSPFASTIATAKLDPPTLEEFEAAAKAIERRMKRTKLSPSDEESAKFGLNATVADYYHPRTLREVLTARRVFSRAKEPSRGERFFWASLLHVLHGNRPYALSRRSHPITPFHPQGPAEYKNLLVKVCERARRLLLPGHEYDFVRGKGIQGDFRDLPGLNLPAFDAVITSPPFLGMRFDRPNWLRLWFCGWGESDFHETSRGFLERQQVKSTDCYLEFFAVCRAMLKDDGLAIVHVGKGGKRDLVDLIRGAAEEHFTHVGEAVEDVRSVERHGLVDKGLTATHHFLFLTARS